MLLLFRARTIIQIAGREQETQENSFLFVYILVIICKKTSIVGIPCDCSNRSCEENEKERVNSLHTWHGSFFSQASVTLLRSPYFRLAPS